MGLPEGQMGNSEVGHMNLGAGGVVKQEITRIDEAVEGGSFFDSDVLERPRAAGREAGRSLTCLASCRRAECTRA